jgi:hypothetical protein
LGRLNLRSGTSRQDIVAKTDRRGRITLPGIVDNHDDGRLDADLEVSTSRWEVMFLRFSQENAGGPK